MNLDRRQQAAALHGSAENRAYAVTDRLGYALAACNLYAELLPDRRPVEEVVAHVLDYTDHADIGFEAARVALTDEIVAALRVHGLLTT